MLHPNMTKRHRPTKDTVKWVVMERTSRDIATEMKWRGKPTAIGIEVNIGGKDIRNAVAFYKPPDPDDLRAAKNELMTWANRQYDKWEKEALRRGIIT